MDLDLFSDYFTTKERQHKLRNITMLMFFMLAAEKIISGMTLISTGGALRAGIENIKVLDVICVIIYLSTAILIAARVRYERIVIPDFFLLGVKLIVIAEETVFLLTEKDAAFIDKFSAGEHILEAVLFGAFLICMFVGELSHGKKLPNFATVCMNLIMICFPVTVLLEIGKVIIAYEVHRNPYITMFNFVRDVLGEAFLDVPYFLLILMVCLTSNRGFKEPHSH